MTVSEQTRRTRIEEALRALPADHETLRVPWREKQTRLPIIRVEIDTTVLNPRSHRIKAQLESDIQASDAIRTDPEGNEAQEAIRALLRATPGYDALKQNLLDEGQRDAGIITRTGRLINANTRAVALLDLGVGYIEVAVLPADATIGEIYTLELDLQVAETYQQDYSFTNELLFVEDLITEQGLDEKEVAIRLRWATATRQSSVKAGIARVQRYVRHLDLIRDIQRMSGGKVPLTDFDDAVQALAEFDAAYEDLRNKDPLAADRMRQARILGLLVNLGYDRQRQVDAEWVEKYFVDALSEQRELKQVVNSIAEKAKNSLTASPGEESDLADFEELPEDSADEASTAHLVVQALVQAMSTSARDDSITLPTPDGERDFDREAIREQINDAMRAASEDAKGAAKAGSDLKLPLHLVDEASKKLTSARSAFERVRSHRDFEQDDLKARLGKAKRALDALQMILED